MAPSHPIGTSSSRPQPYTTITTHQSEYDPSSLQTIPGAYPTFDIPKEDHHPPSELHPHIARPSSGFYRTESASALSTRTQILLRENRPSTLLPPAPTPPANITTFSPTLLPCLHSDQSIHNNDRNENIVYERLSYHGGSVAAVPPQISFQQKVNFPGRYLLDENFPFSSSSAVPEKDGRRSAIELERRSDSDTSSWIGQPKINHEHPHRSHHTNYRFSLLGLISCFSETTIRDLPPTPPKPLEKRLPDTNINKPLPTTKTVTRKNGIPTPPSKSSSIKRHSQLTYFPPKTRSSSKWKWFKNLFHPQRFSTSSDTAEAEKESLRKAYDLLAKEEHRLAEEAWSEKWVSHKKAFQEWMKAEKKLQQLRASCHDEEGCVEVQEMKDLVRGIRESYLELSRELKVHSTGSETMRGRKRSGVV